MTKHKHTDTTIRIWQYAKERDHFSQRECAEFFGVSQPTISKHLRKAIAVGAILVSVNPTIEAGKPTNYYRVNPKHEIKYEDYPDNSQRPDYGLDGTMFRDKPFPFAQMHRTIRTTDMTYSAVMDSLQRDGRVRTMATHAIIDTLGECLLTDEQPDWVGFLEQLNEVKELVHQMRLNGAYYPGSKSATKFAEEAGYYA